MKQNINRLKCPKCNLVNFANSEACKRCLTPLPKQEETNSQLAAEPSQSTQEARKTSITKTVAVVIGAITAVCLIAVLAVFVLYKRQVAANEQIAAANRNHEAARSALNAVAEIQSVTSVGANYQQYVSAVQSAKIKFDAALSDYVVRDAADAEILNKLTEAFTNYSDAVDAWGMFIRAGDEFGFVSESNLYIKQLAENYGFDSTKNYDEKPAFRKAEVLEAIWQKASQNTNSVRTALKRKPQSNSSQHAVLN